MTGVPELRDALTAVVAALSEGSTRFGELDALAGDGDLGVTVRAFCDAVRAPLPPGQAEPANVSEFLTRTARSARSNPSTFSGLMSAALRAAARRLDGRSAVGPADWPEALRAGLETIMERGGARPGDKTVVDALRGSLDAYERALAAGAGAVDLAAALRDGAAEAIEQTRGHAARAGRASWLAERTAGVADPGSTVWLTACAALHDHIAARGRSTAETERDGMTLNGRQIVALAYPGYQELDFWYPVLRGREEGATVRVVGANADGSESRLGYPVVPDATADDVDAAAVAAVILPGVTGDGPPRASGPQLDLLRRAHAGGAVIAATGNAAGLVEALTKDTTEAGGAGAAGAGRVLVAADTDGLPELFRRLGDALDTTPTGEGGAAS